MFTLQCCDLCDSFPCSEGLGSLDLAAWGWLCKGEPGIRDALSRYSLVVGLDTHLCGCFGMHQSDTFQTLVACPIPSY